MELLSSFGFGSSGATSGTITGAGTAPKIPVFTGANIIGDSQITDNGTTVFIGASATSTKALFEIKSTTKGVLLPRMTTVQRDAIATGATEESLLIYNTTEKKYQYWNNTAVVWQTIDVGLDGIYSGSGTIPSSTQATITDNFTFRFGDLVSKGKNNILNNTQLGIGNFNAAITGQHNTAVGYFANYRMVGGLRNTAIGSQALYDNNSNDNTAIGYFSGKASTGIGGTFVGSQAGRLSGSLNVMLGYTAGYYETGSNQLFIDNNARGSEALGRTNSLIYGTFSTTVSAQTLRFNAKVGINVVPTARLHIQGEGSTSATTSLLVQNSALTEMFKIQDNGFISVNGASPLSNEKLSIDGGLSITNGDLISRGQGNIVTNVAVGISVFNVATTGALTTAVGYFAANSQSTGLANTIMGNQAYVYNTTGSYNTVIGNKAGYYNIGSQNAILGAGAGGGTSGSTTYLGVSLFGYAAGGRLTTGNYSTFFGQQSGVFTTTGVENTFIGNTSGYSNVTGARGVYLGHEAGFFETTSDKLFIDNNKRVNEATARTSSLIYGEFSTIVANQILRFNCKVGIGVTPTSSLTVSGDVETLLNTNGFIVLDRTNGNKYRIYTDGGVLNTELVP